MFRILKNVVRVNSTEKEILLGVEFTFTLCVTILFDTLRGFLMKLSKKKHDESANTIHKMTSGMG